MASGGRGLGRPDGTLLESIDVIYDTVLDASRWGEALDRTARAAGAFGSMLVVSDHVMRDLQVHVTSSTIAGHDAQTYVATQLSQDELEWDEALDQVPALTILQDTDIWPDREGYAAMDSVKWLRSWNLYHRSAVRLCAHGGWRDSIASVYPEGRAGMSTEEQGRLSPLLPHLARALEIRRPFALLKSRYHAILTMLDRLGMGVVVLLDDDQILLANDEAERILEVGDGVRRRADGKLGVTVGGKELLAALADLRSGANSDGSTVYLPRGVLVDPYVVDVAPFREGGHELGSAVTGALVCIVDPEHRAVISTRGLAEVYALTPAEAAVCALMSEGRSTQEIADVRGVALETVKSQGKAILRKTLCSNRVELVHRALSIAPPLLDARGRRDDS
jgi:DNA-binding CsgD family transcriptional regulator